MSARGDASRDMTKCGDRQCTPDRILGPNTHPGTDRGETTDNQNEETERGLRSLRIAAQNIWGVECNITVHSATRFKLDSIPQCVCHSSWIQRTWSYRSTFL